jgi:hypothetical protein
MRFLDRADKQLVSEAGPPGASDSTYSRATIIPVGL